MGAEKGGTKSGGFFHLFDWNRKSRKKLFSSGTVSPESTKQEKRSDDNLPTTRLRLIDEDEISGLASVKGSSDYSCASSVTDEEGNAIRAPGVVARLMGLDSMPTSGVSEPSSTPFFDTQSLRDKQNHKRSPEFYINDQFNHIAQRADGYSRKPMERSQKMPSSPIERFQTETLPPRSAKPVPLTHRKLLSPIKNTGFISAENAAHIMEAAAKILDPGHQAITRTKVSSFGPSSIPFKVREPKESLANSQRTSRLLESSKTLTDSSDLRYFRGQPPNRSWNGSEDNAVLRRSPDSSDINPTDTKGKGKSISLAVQAKVNVQRREGLSTSSRSTLVQKDHDEYKLNQPFKSQPNNQKNKQQKKAAAISASGVLRQNNQKQNCLSSRGKLSSKQSTSNQHGRKVLSGDASTTKNKTVNKFSGNSRVGHRREGLETTDSEREGLSSINKDFPQKKRLIEGSFQSEKSGFIENLVDRRQKRVQPNVVIDEHTKRKEDSRSDGADVVSFTFTSPLIKSMPGTQASTQVAEKWDKKNMYCFDTHSQKGSDANNKKLSSHGLNVITGDALSLLLEQKLKELTFGADPSYCNFIKGGSFAASSSVSQDPISAFDALNTSTGEHEKKLLNRTCKDKSGVGFSGVSSNGQAFGSTIKLQRVSELECSSSYDVQNASDRQNLSPLSILEASFSNGSFISCDSSGSTDGSKFACCSSSIHAQNIVSSNSINKPPSLEAEMELSDSASSTLTETSGASEHNKTSHTATNNQDLDYVREILCNALTSKDLSSFSLANAREILDPLLFDKLEDKRRGKDKDGRMRRKLLFDCVNECLNSKCSRHFQAGYQAWAKGVAVVGEEALIKEAFGEISGWKRMGDLMVDELVDKDMSSQLGRWVDFEIEAFKTGAEIQNEIVSSLVDEIIADCLNI